MLSKHVNSAPPAAFTTPARSVAVLPFADMSENHDQEYFSDGLSEELIRVADAGSRPAGSRAYLVVLLQGQVGDHSGDRQHAACLACTRRQRAQVGQYDPSDRSARSRG